MKDKIRNAEKEGIENALRKTSGDKASGALLLGMARGNLYKKIAALGIVCAGE